MNAFEKYLEVELPQINRFLTEQTQALPSYVRPVAEHVLQAGGKRLRPVLTVLTARSFGFSQGDIYPLSCSLELLHSATLLHDDVLDGSNLRRGRQTAHTRFGGAQAILTGDVLLALANRIVAGYGVPRITECLSEAVLRTVSGEVMEIAMMRRADLDIASYYEIITGKTAYLIQAACQCGAIAANATPEQEQAAMQFGLGLGIAFQLVDDALDYTSDSAVSGKPLGGDLREGKATLPLIYYMQTLSDSARSELTAAFAHASLSEERLEQLRADVVKAGHVQKTRAAAGEFLEKARQALSTFPANAESVHMVQALASMLDRDK